MTPDDASPDDDVPAEKAFLDELFAAPTGGDDIDGDVLLDEPVKPLATSPAIS